jgi:hypothetical protein
MHLLQQTMVWKRQDPPITVKARAGICVASSLWVCALVVVVDLHLCWCGVAAYPLYVASPSNAWFGFCNVSFVHQLTLAYFVMVYI